MNDLRTAAQQALEAMRCAVPTGRITLYQWDKVMSDLDAALAQEQTEPVQEPWARDDIIRMAQQAQQEQLHLDGRSPTALSGYWLTMEVADLARFAALVRADEREACAKVCDATPPYPFRPSIEAAHAIRARNHQPPATVADRLARHGIPMPGDDLT